MAVQLLQDIYLFKDLLPKELDQLSGLGTVKSYQPKTRSSGKVKKPNPST
jgi:hypothetical protein